MNFPESVHLHKINYVIDQIPINNHYKWYSDFSKNLIFDAKFDALSTGNEIFIQQSSKNKHS